MTTEFAIYLPGQIQEAVAGTNFDTTNLSALIQAATLNTAAAYKSVPGITASLTAASQLAVKLAYAQAYKVVYYTALGFAATAIVSAFLCRSTDPAKKNLQRAVRLENEKPGPLVPKEIELGEPQRDLNDQKV